MPHAAGLLLLSCRIRAWAKTCGPQRNDVSFGRINETTFPQKFSILGTLTLHPYLCRYSHFQIPCDIKFPRKGLKTSPVIRSCEKQSSWEKTEWKFPQVSPGIVSVFRVVWEILGRLQGNPFSKVAWASQPKAKILSFGKWYISESEYDFEHSQI